MGRIKVTKTEYEKCFCLQKIQRKTRMGKNGNVLKEKERVNRN